MIKISNLIHLEKVKKAQEHVGAYSDYLNDVLKPAIERGNWEELEQLDIGFDTDGRTLGKIDNNKAWKKLQSFFEPKANSTYTLDFSLDGRVIERNFQNELKALILKMMWISPKDHSFPTLYHTLCNLKKCIEPLLSEGVNSFSYINFDLLERWTLDESIQLEFRRDDIYVCLNKLFIEKDGLPFDIALTGTLGPASFNLNLIDPEQFTVIPQRIYYRALCEVEAFINQLYPIRDEIEALSNYLLNFQNNIYKGYAKYLHKAIRAPSNGEIIWRLITTTSKYYQVKASAFIEAFTAIASPTEAQIITLLIKYQPGIQDSFYDKCYPCRHITINGKTISNKKQAEQLLTHLSGACIWELTAKSGMRSDEIYDLHTINGCQKEIISGQTIYVLHADLDKTIKGVQSKQDEFVTTALSMKAYEILQAIHKPLRDSHSSTRFFHKFRHDFGVTCKSTVTRQAQKWFNNTLASELALTNDDIIDLKLSSPDRSFEIGEDYNFSCHQLRRSFAYYLIGYELLSFPQLKQQFSHVSLAMTRHYAKNASKFQKLRKKKGKNKNLCTVIDEERIHQKAQVFLDIYHKLANEERVAGGKGKEFAKRRANQGDNNLFTEKTSNDMLTLEYWEDVIRYSKRHIHVVAPGIYCTSANCSLRTQVNLIGCVHCVLCRSRCVFPPLFASLPRTLHPL